MLRKKLRIMIKKYGKALTKQMLLEEIEALNQKMRSATNIYYAIDIEHDILDNKSMLKWLEAEK